MDTRWQSTARLGTKSPRTPHQTALAAALLLVAASGCRGETTHPPLDWGPDATTDVASTRDVAREVSDGATADGSDGWDGPDADGDTGPSPEPTAFPWSSESTDTACADGRDNDQNGFADCDDFGCSRNPAVTVCGAWAEYESSPAFCSNDGDDDRDGLVDCADPDCAENLFFDSCPAPRSESDCSGSGATDADGDGWTGCQDLDCLATEPSCDLQGRMRVLFDQTADETSAGGPNSDWVVDGLGRLPEPSNPTGPDDWNGALSSFAYELVATGRYLVETLPSPSGRLSFGEAANPQDLSGYAVLVLYEPSRALSADEKGAIVMFVRAGGGLLMVANHVGADRDGNGFSAPQVFNDLIDSNPVAADPFGFRFDEVDANASSPLSVAGDVRHPVLDGAAGAVTRIGFYQGCTARLTGSQPSARGLVQLSPASPADRDIVVGAVETGEGRVVLVTDSALAGDGTDSHGNRRSDHDAWNDAQLDHAALFLNAVDWLARR